MIANMWTEFVRSSTKHRAQGGDFTLVDAVNITPADVAKMMTLLKIARAVHGDPLNEDHYVDAAGYISLDGALSMGDKRVVPMAVKEPAENVDRKQAASLGGAVNTVDPAKLASRMEKTPLSQAMEAADKAILSADTALVSKPTAEI